MGINEDLDEMLRKIGGFGRFQMCQYMLLSLAMMFSCVSYIGFLFTAAIVPHRCLIESCGDTTLNSSFLPPWLDEAVPFKSDGTPESCNKFARSRNGTTTDMCSFNKSADEECHSWVFDGPERTIQTDFLVTCPENEWKLALVGTVHAFGAMIGMPLAGIISDRYGRKTTLALVLVMSSVLCFAKSLANSYQLFLILEFVEPIFGGNIYTICFILAFEMTTPSKRVLAYIIIVISFTMGNAAVGTVAWIFKDWRYILRVMSGPALLFILYFWIMPESARWLVSRGRLGDAKKQILCAAKINKVILGDECMKDWENGQIDRVDSEECGDSARSALQQVSKSHILLARLAVCSFCWTAVNVIYYGLSLNSVSYAGTGNKYLNFISTSLVEAPSYTITWLSLKVLGRRKTMCIALVVCGAACFASPFVPESAAFRLPVYLLGKFAITSAYDTLYIFTAEIFPTKLRNSLLGMCSMIGNIGTMAAPQTPLMSRLSLLLPLYFFGVLSAVAGALALLLPETKGRALPVSIKEAEELSTPPKVQREESGAAKF